MPEGSPATDTPPLLSTSLESTLMRLSDTEHEGRLIHRSLIIGGASLYYDTLKLAPTGPSFVDRILLTRIISPAFEDCDVFMPNFERVGELQGHPWRRVGHNELEDWVGFKVAEGIQEEKGVKYEFQMWVR